MSLLMVLLTFLSEAYVLWWMGEAPLAKWTALLSGPSVTIVDMNLWCRAIMCFHTRRT
jgi:hypothetical protein